MRGWLWPTASNHSDCPSPPSVLSDAIWLKRRTPKKLDTFSGSIACVDETPGTSSYNLAWLSLGISRITTSEATRTSLRSSTTKCSSPLSSVELVLLDRSSQIKSSYRNFTRRTWTSCWCLSSTIAEPFSTATPAGCSGNIDQNGGIWIFGNCTINLVIGPILWQLPCVRGHIAGFYTLEHDIGGNKLVVPAQNLRILTARPDSIFFYTYIFMHTCNGMYIPIHTYIYMYLMVFMCWSDCVLSLVILASKGMSTMGTLYGLHSCHNRWGKQTYYRPAKGWFINN